MSTNGAKNRGSGRRLAFVLCLENGEYEADLLVGKVYRTVKPEKNDRPVDLRVIDESGEDYLFPAKFFVPIEVPAEAVPAFAGAA